MNLTSRHGLLSILLLLFAACGTADRMENSNAAVPASVEELSLQLSTFHRHPSQEAVNRILAGFALHDEALQENTSLMASFLLLATKTYGFTVAGEPKSRILSAYHKADHAAFERWLADGSASPTKNDVLWMAFFVTGSDEPLDRLLALADADRTQTDSDRPLVIDLAGSTAAWSYRSNATQWTEVLDHARRHAATSPIAQQAVADAEKVYIESREEPVVP